MECVCGVCVWSVCVECVCGVCVECVWECVECVWCVWCVCGVCGTGLSRHPPGSDKWRCHGILVGRSCVKPIRGALGPTLSMVGQARNRISWRWRVPWSRLMSLRVFWEDIRLGRVTAVRQGDRGGDILRRLVARNNEASVEEGRSQPPLLSNEHCPPKLYVSACCRQSTTLTNGIGAFDLSPGTQCAGASRDGRRKQGSTFARCF